MYRTARIFTNHTTIGGIFKIRKFKVMFDNVTLEWPERYPEFVKVIGALHRRKDGRLIETSKKAIEELNAGVNDFSPFSRETEIETMEYRRNMRSETRDFIHSKGVM